jgi:hypothetical protein
MKSLCILLAVIVYEALSLTIPNPQNNFANINNNPDLNLGAPGVPWGAWKQNVPLEYRSELDPTWIQSQSPAAPRYSLTPIGPYLVVTPPDGENLAQVVEIGGDVTLTFFDDSFTDLKSPVRVGDWIRIHTNALYPINAINNLGGRCGVFQRSSKFSAAAGGPALINAVDQTVVANADVWINQGITAPLTVDGVQFQHINGVPAQPIWRNGPNNLGLPGNTIHRNGPGPNFCIIHQDMINGKIERFASSGRRSVIYNRFSRE